jgi:hypothetical protein
MDSNQLRHYARVGAQARLAELDVERQQLEAFLNGPSEQAPVEAPTRGRSRRPLTAAQKVEISRRMKRYWAARRKQKAG